MDAFTLEELEEEIAALRGQVLTFSEADTAATTVLAASMTDLSSVYTIPAGSIVGSAYRLTCGGDGQQGSTLQNLTFGFYLGGTQMGTNPVIVGSSPTWNATLDQFRWQASALIVCATTGVSGTWFGSLSATVTDITAASVGAAGSTTGVADANKTAVTKDTTTGQPFSIRAGWASTTGGPAIVCRHTLFERRLGSWV